MPISSPWETSGTTRATPASRRAVDGRRVELEPGEVDRTGRRLEVGEQRVGLGDVEADRAGRRVGVAGAGSATGSRGPGGRRGLDGRRATTEQAADRTGQGCHLEPHAGGRSSGNRYGVVGPGSADPDADRGGVEGGVHDPDDVAADRGQVDLVAQPLGEVDGGSLGVVAGPVEAVVDRGLDPPPERLEQGGGQERGAGDGQGLALDHVAEHVWSRRMAPA